jgi:hypothetical protein
MDLESTCALGEKPRISAPPEGDGRMSDESADRWPLSNRTELINSVDAAWRQLMAAIDGVPPDRLAEPGVAGDWSLKDLLGHIAYWDEHALTEIERALAGLERADNEWQAMNEADYAARRDRTVHEQRAAMDQTHAALLARLDAISDPDAGRVDAGIRVDTYEHYESHVKDIAQWRERIGL